MHPAIQTTVLLMGINLIAKIVGFLREVLLANYYGASAITDAYITANNIPTVLFTIVGVALSTTFIPMYAKIRNRDGEDRAKRFTGNILAYLIIICAALTIIGEIFTKELIFLFASGFKGETLSLTVEFTRILFPCIFVFALMNILGSYLQIHGDYLATGIVPIPGNILIILSLYLSTNLKNIYILIWGTLIGLSTQLFYYTFRLKKKHFKLKVDRCFYKDKYIKELLILVIPVFVGQAINQINVMVDKTLVSRLEEGSVSALNYADKINGVVIGVMIVSIITWFYPKMAQEGAEKDRDSYIRIIQNGIDLLSTMLIFITILIVIFQQDIVKIFFERGAFDHTATDITAKSLAWYAVGLIGIGLRDILSKAFFCIQDTKTPMINGFLCAIINIPLSIVLIQIYGCYGAAIATSIVAIAGSIYLFIKLEKIEKGIADFELCRSMIITIVFTIVIGIGLLFYKNLCFLYLNGGLYYIALVVGCLASGLIYFSMQYLVKNKTILFLVQGLKGRKNNVL